jgi:hypothetical protein
MVEPAWLVQTAGLGLPVVAVAASATRTVVAAASKKGASRHDLTPPVDIAA